MKNQRERVTCLPSGQLNDLNEYVDNHQLADLRSLKIFNFETTVSLKIKFKKKKLMALLETLTNF